LVGTVDPEAPDLGDPLSQPAPWEVPGGPTARQKRCIRTCRRP